MPLIPVVGVGKAGFKKIHHSPSPSSTVNAKLKLETPFCMSITHHVPKMRAQRSERDVPSTSDSRQSSQGLPSPDESGGSDSEEPSRRQSISQSEPTRFEFVDVSSTNARKQARAHVMREFMRQRRKERNEGIELPPSAKVEKRAASPMDSTPPRPAKSRASRDKTSEKSPKSSLGRKATPPRARTTSPAPRTMTALQGPAFPPALAMAERRGIVRMQFHGDSIYQSPAEEKTGLLRRESLGPIPPRSVTRSPRPIGDSSSSLWSCPEGSVLQTDPVILDEEDLPLVEHYLNVVPELMFNFHGANIRSRTGLNPARDIIMPLSMNDPIAFQAASLAFGAGHLARLQGRKDSPQSIKHRVQALQRLREHFFGAKKQNQDFDVMIAMLSLALCEDRFGDSRAAWIHMRAAISLLPNLITETACLKDRRVNAYFNWVLITLSDHESCALKPLLPCPFTSPSATPITDSSLVTNNLLSFLHLLHANPPLPSHHHNSPWPLSPSRREHAFRPSSPLYALMHPPHPPTTAEDANSLLACQIHLSAVLLQLSGSDAATDAFLKSLSIQVVEHDLDTSPSIQPLLWLLLYHTPLPVSSSAPTASGFVPHRSNTGSRAPSPLLPPQQSQPPQQQPSLYDPAQTSLFTSQSVNLLKRTGDVWRQSVGRVCADWLSGRDRWSQDEGTGIDGFDAWIEALREEIVASGEEGGFL